MEQLWARLMRHHRIARQETVPLEDGGLQEALIAVCALMDIPRPLWLGKHGREYEKFGRTAFTQEHFLEAIAFDKLEIERIDPQAPKKRTRDPRIEA